MSIEHGEKSERTPYKTFVEDLKTNYESKLLEPGIVFEIPPISQTGQSMASCFNESEGVIQELRAVIKFGETLYPIIDATIRIESSDNKQPRFASTTLVAKFMPNQRAEIIDISRKRGRLDVGRGSSTQADAVPRNQFSVIQAIDRSIGIIDHFSQQGTVVYTKKQTEDLKETKPISHTIWSVKSAELKTAAKKSNR